MHLVSKFYLMNYFCFVLMILQIFIVFLVSIVFSCTQLLRIERLPLSAFYISNKICLHYKFFLLVSLAVTVIYAINTYTQTKYPNLPLDLG